MGLEAGKVSYNTNLYVSVKDAIQRFKINESDIDRINSDNDKKITLGELEKAGLSKYKALATH